MSTDAGAFKHPRQSVTLPANVLPVSNQSNNNKFGMLKVIHTGGFTRMTKHILTYTYMYSLTPTLTHTHLHALTHTYSYTHTYIHTYFVLSLLPTPSP